MRQAAIGILLVLLLTGCWDRMQLRDLHMIDIVGLDRDEESGEVLLNYVVTVLTKPGQGEGTPISKTTEFKGPSVIEAVGKGEYVDQGPFLAVGTRMFLMSERFASHDPVRELAFLLHAPYTSINTPIIALEGRISQFLKANPDAKDTVTEKLNDLIKSMKTNGTMPIVSVMHFILSREEPFRDIAVPLLKPFESRIELSGALLFREGTYSGAKLSKEQVQMLTLLLGKTNGKQKFTGHLSESSQRGQSPPVQAKGTEYGFSVKKGDSQITVRPESGRLPKVGVEVRLKLNVFYLGEEVHTLKPDYVNQMEQELSRQLEQRAKKTIETMQKANCDVLGIGHQIKAFHPDIWKSLDWREDYPRVSIEPKFDVQILNADAK